MKPLPPLDAYSTELLFYELAKRERPEVRAISSFEAHRMFSGCRVRSFMGVAGGAVYLVVDPWHSGRETVVTV